ncbi:MAG TPA: sulfurtransferase-like selenium metabolism protein YedF [Candidatus Obscuribacterales bacterium]
MTNEQKPAAARDAHLDLRGLVCPEPVLKTKKLLDSSPELSRVEALVESDINVSNLERLCRSMKLKMTSAPDGEFFRVTIERSAPAEQTPHDNEAAPKSPTQTEREAAPKSAKQTEREAATGTVVFIMKDTFGEGDREFSMSLLNVFLQTVFAAGHRPRAVLLANTGVRLMDPQASTLRVLNDFKNAGVEVLACGLCLEYYGLKDKVPKEQITNMFAICEYLFAADKVISP